MNFIKNIIVQKVLMGCTLGLLIFGGTGCSKMLDKASTHVSTDALQWNSISDTRSSLLGIYGLMRAALADNYGFWMYGDMRLGDFTSYAREDFAAIIDNRINSNLSLVNGLKDWRRFYAVVNAANVLMEHAPKVLEVDPKYSDINMQLDVAQARALRAMAYFYMARIWGDVPLIVNAFDNGTFPKVAASDKEVVLNFAQNELLTVANDLPFKYGVGGQTYYGENEGMWNGVLFNKLSAYSLLAHIAAWRGNYLDADVFTDFVLTNYDAGGVAYTSTEDMVKPTGLFYGRGASKIIAFGAMNETGEATQFGHIESLTLAQPIVNKQYPELYVAKDSILNIFTDLRDNRFGLDTATNFYASNYFSNFAAQTPIFSKIKVIRNGVTDGSFSIFSSNIIAARIEDITLLRAEALAALNRKSDAIVSLNKILSLRGESLYTQFTKENIIDVIFAERRRELMGEGSRWYDQIRYEKLRPHNKHLSELINNGGIYWPISNDVLKQNSLLVQNNFWK